MDDTYRITITVTVSKGQYGYGTQFNREFTVNAPLEVLKMIDVSGSASNLFRVTLNELEAQTEEADDEMP